MVNARGPYPWFPQILAGLLLLGLGLGGGLGRGLRAGLARFGLRLVAEMEAPEQEDGNDQDADGRAAERACRKAINAIRKRNELRVGQRGNAFLRRLRREPHRLQLRGDLRALDEMVRGGTFRHALIRADQHSLSLKWQRGNANDQD